MASWCAMLLPVRDIVSCDMVSCATGLVVCCIASCAKAGAAAGAAARARAAMIFRLFRITEVPFAARHGADLHHDPSRILFEGNLKPVTEDFANLGYEGIFISGGTHYYYLIVVYSG